jgi:transcriptional regulator with XRE-family HTH domain
MGAGPDGELPADVPLGSAVVRVMLGAQLRRLREAAGLSPETAGYQIRASRSKISRMETGRVGFKERDVSDLLEFYGVTDVQVLTSMMALASQANAQDWWAKFGDVLPDWFEPYLGLEAAASLIRTFDLQFINGLFQTADYARSVAQIGLRGAVTAEIDRRVDVRMRRQAMLTAARPPRVWSVIDEAALRRAVGGAAVMRGQLRHLAEVARLPDITLQVVPFRIGGHDAAGGSFTVLRFAEPDVPDVVYIEQLTGAMYLERRADVDHYLDVSNRLAATALSPADSMRFFSDVLREL